MGLMANDLVKKTAQYDLKKYTYFATCSRGVAGLYVRADSEFNTLEDLQKAERVKFATSGRGSGTWLWGILLKGIWDIPVHMVSGYLGSSEYITAVIRKDVDALALGFSSVLVPYFHSGELKPLLLFSREPWAMMPDAATLKGTPYEELEDFNNDRVIAGPPGLPDAISRLLENSLLKVFDDPDLSAWAKKTKNSLYIADSRKTVSNINKSMALLRKYMYLFGE
jgi:tripartite-type tricarboxylate transporter receptor subunit TctC